jgi:transposase
LDQLVVGPGVPLTDAQWARIEPLLPDRTPKRGGRRRDHREVIDAIAYKFQTGTQWVHRTTSFRSTGSTWFVPRPTPL